MNCLLCQHESNSFLEKYFRCPLCDLTFKAPNEFLSQTEEFGRYQFHHNEKFDDGYINFLSKLVTPLESEFKTFTAHLDFGCGVRSYYSEFFEALGVKSQKYDLYFYPDKKCLDSKYDLVTCSEVVEHFKNPNESWTQLDSVVKEGGYLAIMTGLLTEDINFSHWWYKNDPTHVVFYSLKTIEFLKNKFNYELYYCDNKSVIIFRKKGSNNV